MPKSNRIYAPIKDYPYSKNRLMIVDFGSLSYHQLYALLSHKNSKYSNVETVSADEEKVYWKAGMTKKFVDLIRLFNPMDIIIAMDGSNSWRNKVFDEYYKKNSKITYDKTGFYISYDNDVVKIAKEGDQYTLEKLKDKENIPTREIKYEDIPERLVKVIDSVFPKYKETRKKREWDFAMTKNDFTELRRSFSESLVGIFRTYRVIVDNAEGDDVIYTVFDRLKDKYESVVLVTRDSDMNQLMTSEKLIIYNHLTEELVTCINPKDYLEIKILSGDTSDSIPGILIPGKKKKLGEAGAKTFFEGVGNESCYSLAKSQGWENQYSRNRQLIDLTFCPTEIQSEIMNILESTTPAFAPFWEIEGIGIPKQTITEISAMKNLGYYSLCTKEEIEKNPNIFDPQGKELKRFTKGDEAKVLSRVGNSSDFEGVF